MAPRIKVEDTLPSGERVSISIEGSEISEERVLYLLRTLRELRVASALEVEEEPRDGTLKERIWRVIVENFGDGTWFSLRDLYNVAAKQIPGLKITTVSTYVSRLVAEGRLVKKGSKPNTRYRVRGVLAEL
jgi:hypothetical protein